MITLVIGAAALLLGLALLRGFASAPPAAIRQAGVWVVGGAAAVGLVVLLVTGLLGQVFWLLAVLGPVGWRAWRSWRARRSFGQATSPGGRTGGAADVGSSEVRTATLAMTLDHASGQTTGTVIAGRFAGRGLGVLKTAELRDLLADCLAADAESVPLLEAWLDRERPDWRAGDAAARPSGPMTAPEALAVLGLPAGADEAAIRAAHRRLMQAAHPDRGGSDWLAARVNEARDVLLP